MSLRLERKIVVEKNRLLPGNTVEKIIMRHPKNLKPRPSPTALLASGYDFKLSLLLWKVTE